MGVKDLTSVRVIADSTNKQNDRLITLIATFPRYLLAELNTHRMFSRNNASSRAIPVNKMIESIRENPYVPSKWMKKHKGMQGNEFFTEEEVRELKLVESWLADVERALERAQQMADQGVSKQIINRTLEPYMWHTAIITFTEGENFFNLRANDQAEPNMERLAYCMLEAINASTPKFKNPGEWHIPFEDEIDSTKLSSLASHFSINELKVRIAIAKCARVSYTVINGKGSDNYDADLKLYDQLISSGHMSPSEHAAIAMTDLEYNEFIRGRVNFNEAFPSEVLGWCGNFKGFVQARKLCLNENRKDHRMLRRSIYNE